MSDNLGLEREGFSFFKNSHGYFQLDEIEYDKLDRMVAQYQRWFKEEEDEISELKLRLEKFKVQDVEDIRAENLLLKSQMHGAKQQEDEINRLNNEKERLFIEIKNLKDKIQEKQFEITNLKAQSNSFKETLSNYLERPDLFNKSEILVELFLERIKNTKKDNKEKSQEKSEPELEPLDIESYLNSNQCLCGSEKQGNSKGCPDCRKKADAIRNRLDISMQEAWIQVWESYGKIVDNSMEEPIENEEELSTSD